MKRPFNEPTWGNAEALHPTHGTPANPLSGVYISIGSQTNLDEAARTHQMNGLTIPIVWRPTEPDGQTWGPGFIYMGGDGTAVPQTYLSGVPTEVHFEVNADSFLITLSGAEFLDELGGSPIGPTLAGAHSIAAQEEYRFIFGARNDGGVNQLDGSNQLDVTFSHVSVIPEPSVYAMLVGLLALGLVIYRRRKG